MGRVGRPEDLAGPAVFLASEELSEELSGFMTGSQMLVDSSSSMMHVLITPEIRAF
jgi:NAD(P)-dependent dehydrogenase (short-subunit alcohol dehydrogenase family)